ncbi:MAG: DNA/RNA non-specific endonuclease [Fibrella sp.]|nr:DNA/RNA non-specific endonuclease [Armatimonadota bacterium]
MSLKSFFGGFLAVVATTVSLSGVAFAQHLNMGNPSGAVASTSYPSNYLMNKPQFSLSYHRDRGTPNWVSWQLNSTWLGSQPRLDNFRADTSLPSGWYRVGSTDYSGSGYDRGHNCPSADRTRNSTDNGSTFLMTNMIPQTPDNNQGPWARLEDYTRSLVSGGTKDAYVIMASRGTRGTIANGRVTAPTNIYKVILVVNRGTTASGVTTSARVIAVRIPNTTGIRNSDWRSYRVSVDTVEAETGYNFLSSVPTSVQSVIEARVDNL